jgi:hypothetical protein
MFQRSQGRGSSYQRKKINATILHVSYEGAEDEAKYFEVWVAALPKRYKHLIKIIPVPKQDNSKSSPSAVVQDLVDHLKKNKVNLNNKGDKAYIVIDVDHHFSGTHMTTTSAALRKCKEMKIKVICNSPAVDLWFICHYENPTDWTDEFKEKALRNKRRFLKSYLGGIRQKETISELIKRTETARVNCQALRNEIDRPEHIPPSGLLPNVDLIWNDIDKMGIKTKDFFE